MPPRLSSSNWQLCSCQVRVQPATISSERRTSGRSNDEELLKKKKKKKKWPVCAACVGVFFEAFAACGLCML